MTGGITGSGVQLPSTAAASAPSGSAGLPTTGAPQTTPTAPTGPVAGLPDLSAMMAKYRYVGPVDAAAGAYMLYAHKGKPWMGLGLIASGIAATISGFTAQGKITKDKELEPQVAKIVQENQQMKATLQQVMTQIQSGQLGGGGAQPGTTTGTGAGSNPTSPNTSGNGGDVRGLPTPGSSSNTTSPSIPSTLPGFPSGTGTGTGGGTGPTTPGTPSSPATPGAGGGGGAGSSTPGASTGPAAPAPVVPDASWTPAAILGSGVDVTAGIGTNGAQLADAGRAVLQQQAGDPNGYATFVEADQAARNAMSTDVFNSKSYRWLTVSHGGRFYAYTAVIDPASSAPVLPPANGALASWHAIRFIPIGTDYHWGRYDWSTNGSSSSIVQ